MQQLWIMRTDVEPHEALKTGADRAVCGDCPLRGKATGTGCKGRACYVLVHNGPLQVFRKWVEGRYADAGTGAGRLAMARAATVGRSVRLGAYGDPGALPVAVLEALVENADGHTGYTHQYGNRPEMARRCMVSVETRSAARAAHAAGARTFRVRTDENEALLPGEIVCPAESRDRKCIDCGLCNGAGPAKSIVITAHGAGKGNV